MKTKTLITTIIISLAFALLIGCGPKPIPEESVLDTPDNHFAQGIRELDRGNMDEAMREFERAKALDPKYAEAYSGMGLVLAERGDFKKALDLADEAIDRNDKSVDCRVIKGRILVKQRKGDDWVKKAVKEFDKAIDLNPNSGKAHYYKGIAYKEAYMFGESASAFRKVIELKGDFAAEADKEWAIVQKIERAAPGTKVGAKIALVEEIDRADLAVLLIEELKLLELLEKKRPKTYDTGFKAPDDPTKMQTSEQVQMAEVTDVENHWAKNWIKDIVKLRGMDVFPDHTFRPDELITRANYAMTMQTIMIMATGDEGLATKYIGETSRFPDVNGSHFAYNAIALMIDRGIMRADKMTGAFDLNGHMSGADALLAIRDFQNALRMTF
jgi:tetratricopeptide (TPR) repeat protein